MCFVRAGKKKLTQWFFQILDCSIKVVKKYQLLHSAKSQIRKDDALLIKALFLC